VTIALDIARTLDPVLLMKDAGLVLDRWQAKLMRSTAHTSPNAEKRVLMLCARQTGKSTTAAGMALHRAYYESGALVVIFSPSQRQSDEMLRTIKSLHNKLSGVPEAVGDSVRKIEFNNGSRIIALHGDEKTVRGISAPSLCLIDEASRVPEEMLAAVRPMIATRPDGALVALSTPFGKRGFFYEAWTGGENWHRVRVTAEDCPRITQAFLDEEMKALGAQRFSEEYGLAFLDPDEAVFPTAIIDRAFSNEKVKPLWKI
jgi:phage terminase large subunit-like protein